MNQSRPHAQQLRPVLARPALAVWLTGFVLLALSSVFQSARADEYSDVLQLHRAGKSPEALKKADRYLEGKPRDPQMRFIKGVILSDAGNQDEALAAFSKLTEDYPELPEPYNNLAVIYASRNQYDKARVALEMAVRTNPGYATAHENLGDVYLKLAGQAYAKSLQLDPATRSLAPKLKLLGELLSLSSRDPKAAKAANAGGAKPGAPLKSGG